ncbi:type II toxin-antitoxin system RelE/ParE family toxin [Geomonas subterranea]|uniref:type II toxin-antitoxin system RelE/ParE family toxin n=1 Tax=Geomonas subterranea TaxID=2847989 RepID=UPI001CD81720|nr:type II toxin-antitoxin system RelE/ParE family toxin [Geomonas fuzhouensis]
MTFIGKTKYFAKWARQTGVADLALSIAVREMEAGLIDADLGGGLVKKRVPLPGQGKRGGARTILATNKSNRWIFIFGFEKNERGNITVKELEALHSLAGDLLALTEEQLRMYRESGKLMEVPHD